MTKSWKHFFQICGVSIDDTTAETPSNYLSCGMEIPIGEAMDLTWNHLMEILNTVDAYEKKGRDLIEKQEYMNELSRPCACPCEGHGDCIQGSSSITIPSLTQAKEGTSNCEKYLGEGWYSDEERLCMIVSATTPGRPCARIVDNRGVRIYDADGKIVCGKGETVVGDGSSASDQSLCCSRDCTPEDYKMLENCTPNTSMIKTRQVLSSSFAPDDCGECNLTCDIVAIRKAHKEVLETRKELKELAEKAHVLIHGFYNKPTENLCDPLNEDIRSNEEKNICLQEKEKLITKHELITRKLNYSRSEFNACLIRPEELENVLMGRMSGKSLIFGPVAEEENLPRYTKTKDRGEPVNTSNFNWFCCEQ